MTQAEKVLMTFNNAAKTISLSVIATVNGAIRTNNGQFQLYTFSDGSKLQVFGRGSSHRVEVINSAETEPKSGSSCTRS
jgi:N-acetylmuramic acid 6-phosphate (MurNAc-6-P) etherase